MVSFGHATVGDFLLLCFTQFPRRSFLQGEASIWILLLNPVAVNSDCTVKMTAVLFSQSFSFFVLSSCDLCRYFPIRWKITGN